MKHKEMSGCISQDNVEPDSMKIFFPMRQGYIKQQHSLIEKSVPIVYIKRSVNGRRDIKFKEEKKRLNRCSFSI
jgi:hypothetical protein